MTRHTIALSEGRKKRAAEAPVRRNGEEEHDATRRK